MNTITIIGLGAGGLDQIPLGVYRLLKNAEMVYVRTKEHPVVQELEKEGVPFRSFDWIYEEEQQFEAVYERIYANLLKLSARSPILYAVPGHPLVAEKTVKLLLEGEKRGECHIQFKGGHSFLDALFQSVRFDPIEGFQLLDANTFCRDEVALSQHLVIAQVYDQFTASRVKLELMELLPDDYPVYVIEGAGTPFERIEKKPLYELDRNVQTGNLISVYVPPAQVESIYYKQFSYLRRIIAILRGPNGCPWDRKQTHESLKPYLLEEAYELLEAIDEQDDEHIIEELGDVLLQVMLNAQIGEDRGYFNIEDVIERLVRKMIARHPHVFGEAKADSAEEVVKNWQALKKMEPGRQPGSVLDSVGRGFPALMKAYALQKEAAKLGFDWDRVDEVVAKLDEEMQELKKAVKEGGAPADIMNEMGDLLFSAVNLSRHLGIHPEEALAGTNSKFIRRFKYIENRLKMEGKTFEQCDLKQLDRYWEEAKQEE